MSLEIENPVSLETNLERLEIDEKAGSSIPSTIGKVEDKGPSVRKLPFNEPAAISAISKRVELSSEEQSKYDIVLEHLNSIISLPKSSSRKEKESAPLSEVERYFLTRECILRYLRATKWKVNEAKKRLEGTIIWGREYGTDGLTAETIEPEVSPLRRLLM
jgi:CRAL/TRIO, N-terminal domain